MKKRQLPDGQYAHNIPSLMDETPISFYPNLAKVLGVNEAIVLQQIWFYVNVNRENESERHHVDGKWWVYNSYKQWCRKFFPWLTPRGLQNIILNLEKLNILESKQGVEDKYDRRKWYTVNRDALNAKMISAHSAENVPYHAEDASWEEQNMNLLEVQNMHKQKTENTTENTTERKDSASHPFDAHATDSNPSTSSLQGAEKSARTDKAPTQGKRAEDEQQPPSDGGAVPPKLKSILAWIIDDTWSGQHSARECPPGMSKRMLGPLMGTAKDKDKRLEPKATEEEIYAFGRWYRYYNPQLSLPSDGKVASWFGQFRAHPDYARRVQDAHLYVERLYRNPPPIVPEEPKVYVDPAVGRAAVQEALRALYPNRYSGDAS